MTVSRKSLQRGLVLLSATLFAVALLSSASPAEAGWMPKRDAAVAGGVAVGGVAWSLKESFGEATDHLGELLDAAVRGDTNEVKRISQEFKQLPVELRRSAFPVLSLGAGAPDAAGVAGERIEKRLDSAKRTIGRFVGKAGGTVTDARAALAIDQDERPWYESEARVLGKTRLPAVKVVSRTRQAPDPYPGTLADAWGMDAETRERSRHAGIHTAKRDPWAQDAGDGWDSALAAAPAAEKTDVWGDDVGAHEPVRRVGASVSDIDPWAQDSGQRWDGAVDTPLAGSAGDEQADPQWQDEYAVALNHLLGHESGDGSYEAALNTVERLELEAVRRQQERERQARLEAEEGIRQARLAYEEYERQTQLEEERERQARLEADEREWQLQLEEDEWEEDEWEAQLPESTESTVAMIARAIQDGLAIAQEQSSFAQQLQAQRQRAEQARRQQLAAIERQQAQQRQAEQARYQQQQRQQQQLRRQAEEPVSEHPRTGSVSAVSAGVGETDEDGCWSPPDRCIEASSEWTRTYFRSRYRNICDKGIVLEVCHENTAEYLAKHGFRSNLHDCGQVHLIPGKTKKYDSIAEHSTGRSAYLWTGSRDWKMDWVCISKAGGLEARDRFR